MCARKSGDLSGKTALITGASKGLGKAMALALSQAGATIALVSRDRVKLQAVQDEIEELGGHAKTFTSDVSDEDSVSRLRSQVFDHFDTVQILINNAGITGPTGRADQLATGDWDKTLQTNLRTPFVLSRAVIPSMIERKTGRIINISSIAGKMAYPLRAPYAASKWGLVGLTLTLAQELGPYNVRVNVVCPGPTRTELIDSVIRARAAAAGVSVDEMFQEYVRATALKRMVLPEEVADVVLFLCSPESDAITGQAIDVSAGYGFRLGN